jgi:hypothetical protein
MAGVEMSHVIPFSSLGNGKGKAKERPNGLTSTSLTYIHCYHYATITPGLETTQYTTPSLVFFVSRVELDDRLVQPSDNEQVIRDSPESPPELVYDRYIYSTAFSAYVTTANSFLIWRAKVLAK